MPTSPEKRDASVTLGASKQRDKSHSSPLVQWLNRPGFTSFGDRLNFLSPERAHLETGRMSILPPSNPEKRKERKNG